MRATAANKSLARNCGIRTDPGDHRHLGPDRALCGLAGVVFAMDSGSFDATATDLFLVLILAAVFLGGPGQAYGAMLGAVVIGLATEISAAYITADYKYVVAFVALLIMLGVRPTGLLGARTPRPGDDGPGDHETAAGSPMNAFYLINLLVYAAVDAMACLGLSQQFGVVRHQLRLHHLPGRGRLRRGDPASPARLSQRRVPVLHRRMEPACSPFRGSARRSSAA